jgi:UDP-glucose 4-epimerase
MTRRMNVLVTGGAGYIGSHLVLALLDSGYGVRALDDLSRGDRRLVPPELLTVADLCEADLAAILLEHRIDAVIHLAARVEVGVSMSDPHAFYTSNLLATLRLLDAMRRVQVRRLVFSSSAAVYGMPLHLPIREDHPQQPISPYGATKQAAERAIADYASAYGLRAMSLRYFNVAGADPGGRSGSLHCQESHLLPCLMQHLNGRRAGIELFGSDYATRDGSCERDYVHVSDLCEAHLLALDALDRDPLRTAYNLGSGAGSTVSEVVAAAKRVTGRRPQVHWRARRAGDPAVLIADASAARRELGWTPRHRDLETLVEHAWRWEQSSAEMDRGHSLLTAA